MFYLCFLQSFDDKVHRNRTVCSVLITISSKVSVFATVSLKTNWKTPLTGSKKGEYIFHLEIVHLVHLIFLSVQMKICMGCDMDYFVFKRENRDNLYITMATLLI